MGSPKNTLAKPFLITIPHSGEKVPKESPWLAGLPETLLMFDVDRYVDKLYEPIIAKLGIPSVKTEWHRYAIDLNRLPEDVDLDSVVGHKNASGKFPRGLHWRITTTGEKLMPGPMTIEVHDDLVKKYFDPFHSEVREALDAIKKLGPPKTYHLDAHSMPSLGTKEHRDPGEYRADIVVGDCEGTSCSPWYKDLVMQSYKKAGFKVALNWPYKGGRVTETYGKPELGQEAIQVELNRALYMNETSKQLDLSKLSGIQAQIAQAVEGIYAALPSMP